MELEFTHILESLMVKYYDPYCQWLPLEEWDSEDLVDLEIMANGELQRREGDDSARTIQ